MRVYPILLRTILILIAHQQVIGNDPYNKLL